MAGKTHRRNFRRRRFRGNANKFPKNRWFITTVVFILILIGYAYFHFYINKNEVEGRKVNPDLKILQQLLIDTFDEMEQDFEDSTYIDTEVIDHEKLDYDYYYDINDTYANETKASNMSMTEKEIQLNNGTEHTLNITKEGSGIDLRGKPNQVVGKSEFGHVVQKRSVIASTHDGVPINSEPYSQSEHKMKTAGLDKLFGKVYTVRSAPAKPSAFGWSTQPETNYGFSYNSKPFTTPAPNVRHLNGHPRIGKNLKSADSEIEPENNSDSNQDFTIVRKPSHEQRNSNMEIFDENHFHFRKIKPLPVTQYNGDTSKYVLGQHTNFNGNGHLRHPQRTFVDWTASNWVQSAGMGAYFSMDNGIVSIKENGLYFIYAQIYYLDEHDMVGYRVYRNGDIILQCTITHHSSARKLKGNTCFTAGVEYLSEGDSISLADITEGKYSLFEPGKSFFGMIRIGDLKLK